MRSANKRDHSLSNRLTGEWLDWCQTKERIGEQLRKYYQAYTTEELPPRLLALIKKLDHEEPERPQGAPKSSA
jgi:hypothetical protein